MRAPSRWNMRFVWTYERRLPRGYSGLDDRVMKRASSQSTPSACRCRCPSLPMIQSCNSSPARSVNLCERFDASVLPSRMRA